MEINTEAGFASTNTDDLRELIEEFESWFSQANPLDKSWLEDEQQKLLARKEEKPSAPEVPFTALTSNDSFSTINLKASISLEPKKKSSWLALDNTLQQDAEIELLGECVTTSKPFLRICSTHLSQQPQ